MSNRNLRVGLVTSIVAVLVASSVLAGLAHRSTAFDGNGNYVPPIDFWAQDTNADGKYNWLWINITLDVTVQDVFTFDLTFSDSANANTIATKSNMTYFLPGVHTVPMLVEGFAINVSGYDGQYWANFQISNEAGIIIATPSAQSPTAYNATDFERPPAIAGLPFGDHGVDMDSPPDGAFNQFHFSFNVTFYEPGIYMVAGLLATTVPPMTIFGMSFLGVNATAGNSTYEMAFGGMSLNASGLDGPYLEIGAVLAPGAGGSPVMISMAMNTSGPYLTSEFQTRVPRTVTGTVTDGSGQPVSGATVRFLNYMDISENSTMTDVFGKYSIDLYDGDFLSYVTGGGPYLDEIANRTVSGPSIFDYVLSDLPPQRMDVTITMLSPDSGWEAGTMESSNGVADFRLVIDWQMGNRDGYVSHEEQLVAFAMMGPMGGPVIGDTWNQIYVDDIFYYPDDYAKNLYSFDFTGSVYSTAPLRLDMRAHYHSNSTIPSQMTHLLRISTRYDSPTEDTTYTLNLPPGWVATSYDLVQNLSVMGIGTGIVVVDPLGNPGLPNNFWVNITITDPARVPPDVTLAWADPTPQEYMQPVAIYAHASSTNPMSSVTVNITAPIAGPLLNDSMTYDAIQGRYEYILNGYPDLGAYSFTVWAKDVNGNFGSGSGVFKIQDTTPPVAEAGPDQSVPPGSTVTLDGSASTDNFRVDNWTWTFDDGVGPVTLYGAVASHIFSVVGNYVVTLTVTDTSANSGTDAMLVRVLDPSQVPPTIQGQSATPDPQEYMQPVMISAWANDSAGIAAATVNVLTPSAVSLGNFTMSLNAISGKYEYSLSNYPALGVYTYTIWARDNDGNYGSGIGAFRIRDTTNPTAEAGQDQSVINGTTVTLDGSASTDNFLIDNWTWTFNDGTGPMTLYGQSASHQFTVFGSYTVTLTARDTSGNAGTDTMTVNVIYPPTPNAPTNVAAVQTGTGEVTVTWVAPTLNTNGSAITGSLTYWVYRATSPAGSYGVVSLSAVSTTQYVDTSVSPGTYYYKVQAENQWHNTSALSTPEASVVVTDRGSINGTVMSGGQRLQGALVEVLNSGGHVVASANTSADGSFIIGNLAPGQYTVRASKDGYDPAEKPATVSVFARRDVGVIELTKKTSTGEMPWMWIAIIVVVIAIVLSLLAILMRKRRKPAVQPGTMPPPQGIPPMQQGPPPPTQQPPIQQGPPGPYAPPPPPP